MANTTLTADAGTFTLTGQTATFTVDRAGLHGYTPTNAATTQITLTDLLGFDGILAALPMGIVTDAACYFAFGDAPVTIDTANDVFIPAGEMVVVTATGPYLGFRSVTAGTANVRIWI